MVDIIAYLLLFVCMAILGVRGKDVLELAYLGVIMIEGPNSV